MESNPLLNFLQSLQNLIVSLLTNTSPLLKEPVFKYPRKSLIQRYISSFCSLVSSNYQFYYRVISKQIREILREAFEFNNYWQAGTSRLVLRMLERCRPVAMKQIIDPTLKPLVCSFFESAKYEPEISYVFTFCCSIYWQGNEYRWRKDSRKRIYCRECCECSISISFGAGSKWNRRQCHRPRYDDTVYFRVNLPAIPPIYFLFQMAVQQSLVEREEYFAAIELYLEAADEGDIINFLTFLSLDSHHTFHNVIRLGPSRALMFVQPNDDKMHEYAHISYNQNLSVEWLKLML